MANITPCTMGCKPPPCPTGFRDMYGVFACQSLGGSMEGCDPANPLSGPCNSCCRVCSSVAQAIPGVPAAIVWSNCSMTTLLKQQVRIPVNCDSGPSPKVAFTMKFAGTVTLAWAGKQPGLSFFLRNPTGALEGYVTGSAFAAGSAVLPNVGDPQLPTQLAAGRHLLNMVNCGGSSQTIDLTVLGPSKAGAAMRAMSAHGDMLPDNMR